MSRTQVGIAFVRSWMLPGGFDEAALHGIDSVMSRGGVVRAAPDHN